MASVFDIPVISWVATAPILANKQRFSTLTRTLGPVSKVAIFLLEILRFYDWHRVCLISSEYLHYQDVADAMHDVFSANNVTITFSSSYKRYATTRYIRRTLLRVKTSGRSKYTIFLVFRV